MASEEGNQDAGNTRQRAVALVASSRRRGSTVQGTDKRTKTQRARVALAAVDDTIGRRADPRHDRGLDRPAETSTDLLNTHAAPVRH